MTPRRTSGVYEGEDGQTHTWQQLALPVDDGDELKAAGMERALLAADVWTADAIRWVRSRQPGVLLTSEHVTAAVGLPRGEPGMNANNAVGALMNTLRSMRLLESTGQMVKSRRRSSHSALIAVWMRTGREQC